MFHLKKGDSKIFDLTLSNSNDFKEYLNIVSFNLRMTKYSMKVQIVDNDKSNDSQEANVVSNWIGGQQSLIYPKNFILSGNQSNNLLNYSFKIVIYAHEAGVFNIEATSGNTVIALGNSNLRFDTVTSETPICYYYDVSNNKDKKIIVDLKSINGDISVYTNQDKIPSFDDYTRKFTVGDEKDEKLILDTKDDMKKWFFCVETKDTAYYNIHIYNEATEKRVQTYKNLLYRLLISKEMYSIPSIHGYQSHENHEVSFAKRVLQADTTETEQPKKTTTNSNATTKPVREQPNGIHMTGNGLAGLFVFGLLLFPVIWIVGMMDSIFVNTKLVERSLLVGKIDN